MRSQEIEHALSECNELLTECMCLRGNTGNMSQFLREIVKIREGMLENTTRFPIEEIETLKHSILQHICDRRTARTHQIETALHECNELLAQCVGCNGSVTSMASLVQNITEIREAMQRNETLEPVREIEALKSRIMKHICDMN